jgi:hypothetical protein
MPQYSSFAQSNVGGWSWTGVNNQNQVWSYVRVSAPILVTDIYVRWSGYGAEAYAFHCIWDTSGNLLVKSNTVTAASRSASGANDEWHNIAVTPTYLPAGDYRVGIWCNPAYPRWWTQWYNGTVNNYSYMTTATSSPIGVNSWSGSDTSGVIASTLLGEDAGRAWVNDGGTWKKGQVWVNNAGTWTRAKAVWVNNGGTWVRNK